MLGDIILLVHIINGTETLDIVCHAPIRADLLLRQTPFSCAADCGGKGICGKCRIYVKGSVTPPDAVETKFLSQQDLLCGIRLACRVYLLSETTVSLIAEDPTLSPASAAQVLLQAEDIGIAVDIGTTTIAAVAYAWKTQKKIWESSCLNPQRKFGADVITRLSYASEHGVAPLQHALLEGISALLAPLSRCTVRKAVYTGNTVMLHFLTGRNISGLLSYPFTPNSLFGETCDGIFLPRCISAFVGADITCGIAASGMLRVPGSLLVDLGTNGEMAAWNGASLYTCSTAAGPAFEGIGIRCGMPALPGAIYSITNENGTLQYQTIANAPPRGICASALISLAAALLRDGLLTSAGYLAAPFQLTETIRLYPEDIRNLQLAKGAIAAGIACLASRCGNISRLYLAGSFGENLPLVDAAQIGLFPQGLLPRIQLLGNTALRGAKMFLFNSPAAQQAEEMSAQAVSLSLEQESQFLEKYMECMTLSSLTI